MTNFLTVLLGRCLHTRQSWPRSTINGKRCATYRVCLDCGYPVPYTKIKFVEKKRRR